MHIVKVNLSFQHNIEKLKNQADIQKLINGKISIINRAEKDHYYNENSVDIFLVNDEFDQHLLWWQNPEKVNELVGSLNPDIVHIPGLNLPLHYRWIKHCISKDTIILAEHTGEQTWPQKNLWLQQFGLRVVNGFIFHSKDLLQPWLKCAAILEKQPVYILSPESDNYISDLANIYKTLYMNKLKI